MTTIVKIMIGKEDCSSCRAKFQQLEGYLAAGEVPLFLQFNIEDGKLERSLVEGDAHLEEVERVK